MCVLVGDIKVIQQKMKKKTTTQRWNNSLEISHSLHAVNDQFEG